MTSSAHSTRGWQKRRRFCVRLSAAEQQLLTIVPMNRFRGSWLLLHGMYNLNKE